MIILGIDYGLHNLGFATAETPLSVPHSVVHVQSLQEALAHTCQVVTLVHPNQVVVGIPEGEIAHAVTTFVEALRPLITVPILTHPETLSSQEAIAKLRAGGASRAKLALDHAYAACLIIEDYLDMHPALVKI